MLGVTAWGCPPRHPIQSFRSSTAIIRTLGRPGIGSAGIAHPESAISATAMQSQSVARARGLFSLSIALYPVSGSASVSGVLPPL